MTSLLRRSPSGPISDGLSSGNVENLSTEAGGATLTTALDNTSTKLAQFKRLKYDEFIGGNVTASIIGTNANACIGDLKWNTAGSGTLQVTRTSSFQSVYGGGRDIGVSAGATPSGIYLGPLDATARGIPLSRIVSVEGVWEPNASSGLNGFSRVGLGQLITSGSLGGNAICFEQNDLLSNNLRIVAYNGGVLFGLTTSIPVQNTPGAFRMEHTASRIWRFLYDGAFVVELSGDDVPSEETLVSPIVQVDSTPNSGFRTTIGKYILELAIA